MTYNPAEHHRRSIRLKEYDYSLPGSYFITNCTQDHVCLFGEIINGEMILNEMGKIIADEWIKSAKIRNEIQFDEWVIMPNHFHAIAVISRVISRRDDRPVIPEKITLPIVTKQDDRPVIPEKITLPIVTKQDDRPVIPTVAIPPIISARPNGPKPQSIGALMAGFKSAVTTRINRLRRTPGVNIWQNNYWEHIIRDENECNRIRQYIIENPRNWDNDKLKDDNENRIAEPAIIYDEEPWML
jgi:REP element-mobilizing transposase RayT